MLVVCSLLYCTIIKYSRQPSAFATTESRRPSTPPWQQRRSAVPHALQYCLRAARHTRLKSLPNTCSVDYATHTSLPLNSTTRSFSTNSKPARSLASLCQHHKISTPTDGTSLPSHRPRAQEQVKLTASLLTHHVRHAFAPRAGHQEERILLRHPRSTRTPASP